MDEDGNGKLGLESVKKNYSSDVVSSFFCIYILIYSLLLSQRSLNVVNFVFSEMVECFEKITDDQDCRVAVLSGAGKLFTAGEHKY